MPGLLTNLPLDDDARRRNDRESRPLLVVAVVAVLLVYIYLFTSAHQWVGLPAPASIATALGVDVAHVFDADGLVNFEESVTLGRFEPEPTASLDEWESFYSGWALFYASVIGAFVSAYFLPLRYKQPALVWWSLAAIVSLYGVRGAAGLLAAHLVVYLTLHPSRSWARILAPVLPAGVALLPVDRGIVHVALWIAALVAWGGGYRYGALRLLDHPRIAPVVRTLVVQSAILTVFVGALVQGLGGREWQLPLGLLLFFWNWARVILYHIDYKDGLVPSDVPPLRYLAVFFTPGAIAYWDWGGQTGQGYAYANNNFLCRDKNELVRSGLQMLLLALGYLVLWDWGRALAVALFERVGVPVFDGRTVELVRHFSAGGAVGTASVLATTFVDLLRWLLIFGGMVHFKVAVWRICGYRIDAYFDKPWLSTNLVTFWSRFTFHYREFLVRAFYYPVFFRFFKKHRGLRIVAATMAAAGAGNLIWGHMTEGMYDGGLQFAHFGQVLRSWPYFVLLGGGISVAQLYLLRRKRRRQPWTPGPRIALDLLAAYCTLQYYALILIFRRAPLDSSVADQFRLLLIGFGIHL